MRWGDISLFIGRDSSNLATILSPSSAKDVFATTQNEKNDKELFQIGTTLKMRLYVESCG